MPYTGDRKREYQRKWMAARRQEFFNDKECNSCGSKERLELDHIDPALKISHSIWSWSKEKQASEITKCQVLCYNCHQHKTILYNRELFSKPIQHGTEGGYSKKGCRCLDCKTIYSMKRHEKYLRTGT